MKLMKWVPFALIAMSQCAMASDWYVVGDVTHSKDSLSKGAFDSSLSAAGATGLTSSDSGSSNQWRVQLGYDVSKNLALEAGYIDMGKSKYSATYTGGTATGELKAGGFDLAVLGKLPVTDDFSVFLKGGLVAAKVKSSLTATPTNAATGKASVNDVSPLLGLGASYKLSDNLDLRAEYDHVNGIGKKDKTGTMNSNMVSLGMAYHF